MLIIRNAQIRHLQHAWREQWIDGLCQHVKGYFPHAAAPFDATLLRATIARTIDGAAQRHGYTSTRDLMRYLNLAATYGWDFEQRSACSWMGAYLHDPGVTCASARLERLVQRCIAGGLPEPESPGMSGVPGNPDRPA